MLPTLLILIFIRPFISSLAFPHIDLTYSLVLISFIFFWIIIKGLPLRESKTLRYQLILFIIALFISSIFAHDKLVSIKELFKYLTGILLFLITVSLSRENKNLLIRCIILAGVTISFLAIYQYFFGFQHLQDYVAKHKISDPFILEYINQKRVFSPFVTPNTLAGYLIMIIPLALIDKNRIWLIAPLSFALFLTKSLSAFFSISIGIAVYFYLQNKLGKKSFIILSGLLIIIGLIAMARMKNQELHLQPIFSAQMRLHYWKDTLRIIKGFPFIGVGLGNFNLLQSRYAHNSYLQICAEMGIFGLICFLWLIGGVLKFGLGNIKNNFFKKQAVGLMVASFVFLIHNFFDFTFFLPEVANIWWAVLGMTIPFDS